MKIKITKINLLFLSIIFALVMNSCIDNDENNTSEEIELSNNLLIKGFNSDRLDISQTFKNTIFSFKGDKSNNIVNSHFTISTLNQKVVYETEYTINNTEENYKLNQTDKILDIANSINYGFKQKTYEEIEQNMHIFFKNVLKEFHDKNISSILDLLYFHNSIISIKKRNKQSIEKDCECTLHPGYLLDKTGFICQEDFFIPIEIIDNILTETSNEDIFNKTEKNAFKEYMSPFISSKKKFISFDKFYSFFVSKESFNASLKAMKKESKNKSSRGCWFGQGSGHGCCGNYGGCCYYRHPLCYVHDKMCTNCTPRWFCFSGCVPDEAQEQVELPTLEEDDLDDGIVYSN